MSRTHSTLELVATGSVVTKGAGLIRQDADTLYHSPDKCYKFHSPNVMRLEKALSSLPMCQRSFTYSGARGVSCKSQAA